MANDTSLFKKRAPTLYFIIAMKLLKGALLLVVAFSVYRISDRDLPELFRQVLMFFHLDPEKKFFTGLADRLDTITERRMEWIAAGTVVYSLFSLVEGVGLMFRAPWAGWLAIGESAFFIPIELFELEHRFSWALCVILAFNVLIVWYLYQNRERLFRHHH